MKVTKERLKVLRARMDLTQEKLAEKSGVSRNSIALYEVDESRLRKAELQTLERLAKALGVTVEEIDKGEGRKNAE